MSINKVSDKQAKLNAEYKIVSEVIRNDFDSCQCCNKIDDRNGSFCHEIAHIIGRRVKKYFADRRNLLLLCKDCHKNLDSYKAYFIHSKNKELFGYIINWLNSCGEMRKANKLVDSLNDTLSEYKKDYDPREFQEDGNTKISDRQRGDYRRNVITQYVKWFKVKNKDIKTSDKIIGDTIHEELKRNVLIEFGIESTEQLNTQNAREYIDSCFIYFGEVRGIDIFEYGKF